ncbi:MAG: TraB/GumN family protein, partial [Sphingomicrobium sp.]
ATTRLAIDSGKANGMEVGNGADMVLRHVAQSQGKPVEALETLESQLAMFTRIAGNVDRAQMAAQAPSSLSEQAVAGAMAGMQSAWKRGDQAVLVSLLDQFNRSSPATYRMLFTDRNGRWADWVAARMQTPGVVFVAVGAGHLAGPDSLLVQLAMRGIPSRRVN